jgi:hypothetical protein
MLHGIAKQADLEPALPFGALVRDGPAVTFVIDTNMAGGAK